MRVGQVLSKMFLCPGCGKSMQFYLYSIGSLFGRVSCDNIDCAEYKVSGTVEASTGVITGIGQQQ
jgi:hypothetical protein